MLRPIHGAEEVRCTNGAHLRHHLRNDAERWVITSDLGVSLHAMRELGHWQPFRIPGFLARRANRIARAITPYAPTFFGEGI